MVSDMWQSDGWQRTVFMFAATISSCRLLRCGTATIPQPTQTWQEADTGHLWVPIDDENCMVWNWMYSWGDPLTEEERMERRTGNGPDEVDQKTFRPFRNRDNSWLIDREMQRSQNFSGIAKVNAQDRAVQELQGRIADRTKEHLGPADKVMISARQLLLRAAKMVAVGEIPMGADASYYCARGATKIIPADRSWQELMREEMYPAEKKAAGAISGIGRVA